MSTGFAVITENDESKWDDETGVQYHYPVMYQKYLEPGTKVVYYKGRIGKDKKYESARLSNQPHYFGVAEIASIDALSKEEGGGWMARLINYQEFLEAVPHKVDGETFEDIPESQKSNYWRRSVRGISPDVFERILDASSPLPVPPGTFKTKGQRDLSSTGIEGKKRVVYTTVYERDPKLRKRAIDIHGLRCKACDFHFGETYGDYGKGLIHIHHTKPLFENGEAQEVDPKTDLIPLCANCHTIVHRRRDRTLTVEQVMQLIKQKELKA
ncbi:HNH endonuclease [Marinobacter adhaerens]|uniref:HNH endonuclease n=1 Tax=Marinobacter adhaerens (strain DSM 23420 / HP15) TaxID=225937 RepID=E4PPK3_MARAH|nr:HNH endonuclease [Marinobacter adhaerens]ADP98874.1 HNH endonuclease [Marinobacter adhaerens HP15]MBW4978841.1 HNH endonuclease [Marinobacter adhaerens]